MTVEPTQSNGRRLVYDLEQRFECWKGGGNSSSPSKWVSSMKFKLKNNQACVYILLSTINLDENRPLSLATFGVLKLLHCLDLTRMIDHEYDVASMSVHCTLQ